MKEADWKNLNRAVTALFEPGLDLNNFPERAFHAIREVLACDLCAFAALEPASGQLQVAFDQTFPDLPDMVAGFGRHMAKYKAFNFDPWVAGGKPFLRGDFLSDREFRNLDIYSEGFRRAGITDHAAIPVDSAEPERLFFGVEREGGGTFEDADREPLGHLQPHLSNAREIALAGSRLHLDQIDPAAFVHAGLTPREAEVLLWLVRGKSNGEIGTILHLRLQTVKGHMATIFNKLGVDNRYAAVIRGLEVARNGKAPTRRAHTVIIRAPAVPAR